jgi:hypothetical protein
MRYLTGRGVCVGTSLHVSHISQCVPVSQCVPHVEGWRDRVAALLRSARFRSAGHQPGGSCGVGARSAVTCDSHAPCKTPTVNTWWILQGGLADGCLMLPEPNQAAVNLIGRNEVCDQPQPPLCLPVRHAMYSPHTPHPCEISRILAVWILLGGVSHPPCKLRRAYTPYVSHLQGEAAVHCVRKLRVGSPCRARRPTRCCATSKHSSVGPTPSRHPSLYGVSYDAPPYTVWVLQGRVVVYPRHPPPCK